MSNLHLNTIGALMTLQGYINNEIAKHENAGDYYAASQFLVYLQKIEDLESEHYAQYKQLKMECAA